MKDADKPLNMAVKSLKLTNFRNYSSVQLETGNQSVVLTGLNGVGKTNLLESISLLTPGRGMRRSRLSELTRNKIDRDIETDRVWSISAKVAMAYGDESIITGLSNAGAEKRTVRIGGKTVKSQISLSEYVNAQWLTPQMDGLLRDSKAGRRKFLDRLVFGYDNEHVDKINTHDHAMRERSRLLKEGNWDDRWLAILESRMASNGVAVGVARIQVIDRLKKFCNESYQAFPGVGLSIVGDLEKYLTESTIDETEDRVRKSLAKSRLRDSIVGGACIGPHKSDLCVQHLDKGLVAEVCSTGEQKALLIAIILAHIRMISEERGRVPILLLDEVIAHLDEARRRSLFSALTAIGGQVWLSGTDPILFEPLVGNANFFSVSDGRVTPQLEMVR